MPVRNVAAGLVVKESIVANIPGARIDVLELDLSSMASVRRFASEFESLNLPLNILMYGRTIPSSYFIQYHQRSQTS